MHHQNTWRSTFAAWLPFAVIIIIFSGLVYVAVQQNYRLSANDPQIQIAEDVTEAINKGNTLPDAIVSPTPSQELSSSLVTFLTVYNATGTPIGSSVALNGKMPTLPAGVFDFAKKHGVNKFTWQPQKDIRVAAVLTSYKSGQVEGFVLAGRSIREIEKREAQLLIMTAIAALAALVLTYLAMLFLMSNAMLYHEHEHKHEDIPDEPHHHEHPHPHS